MSHPRILILTTSYLPMLGGSELAIKNIAERLPEWDFDLVTGRYASDLPAVERMGRIRVFRAGGRLARLAILLPKNLMPIPMAITAWRLARIHDYALMHAYQASQAAGAGWLLKFVFRVRLPFLVTLQEGKDLHRQPLLLRLFRRLIFTQVDAVTAISGYLCAYAKTLTRSSCTLIPNGVDVQAFAPPGPRPAGHGVISVSRLVPKNGLMSLIRAMPLVAAEVPDARLVLVGDGPLRKELQALSSELHAHVGFAGSVAHGDLPRHLHEADVFVRPSLSEGLGSAFLEAMAAGVPVVGSAVGGISDFLRHEETGLVCDPQDPADIARQIVRVFTDTALRERVVANAAAAVRERYDWDAVARQMEEVYKEMQNEK